MPALKKLLRFSSEIVWRIPGKFALAGALGSKYSLRCVLFHDISDRLSPFTDGLGVTMGTKDFEERIRFLTQNYTPIDLETFLTAGRGGKLPRRPVLITFDDAYASVAEQAAPICRKYGVPACFFVNGAMVGNRDVSIDNFVCYVANTYGLQPINAAARKVNGPRQEELRSVGQVALQFLPALSRERLEVFKGELAAALGINLEELAAAAKLYLSPEQLRGLVASGFEIGNHTLSHVHCRILSGQDLVSEIDQNKATLEALSGSKVRSFSVPYGSIMDFNTTLEAHLKRTGHEASFLVESRANSPSSNRYLLNRVSLHAKSDGASFAEIELLPRLRSLRDALLGARKLGPEPMASSVQ